MYFKVLRTFKKILTADIFYGGAGCAAPNDGLLCPVTISLRQITSNFIAGSAYHTGARAIFGINHAKQPEQ